MDEKITEALAIELTKNCLKNGQDEKPISWRHKRKSGYVVVEISGNVKYIFNRVEVAHAILMLKNKGEKK